MGFRASLGNSVSGSGATPVARNLASSQLLPSGFTSNNWWNRTRFLNLPASFFEAAMP